MKVKYYLLILITLGGILVPLSPLGAIQPGKHLNLEDVRRGKREMKQSERMGDQTEEKKMDGLSLGAYVTTITGLASLFILPAMGVLLLPVGFILGIIAWRSRKRYENRRGQGLALAAVAIGGGFTLMVAVSLVAFFVSFGVF